MYYQVSDSPRGNRNEYDFFEKYGLAFGTVAIIPPIKNGVVAHCRTTWNERLSCHEVFSLQGVFDRGNNALPLDLCQAAARGQAQPIFE